MEEKEPATVGAKQRQGRTRSRNQEGTKWEVEGSQEEVMFTPSS